MPVTVSFGRSPQQANAGAKWANKRYAPYLQWAQHKATDAQHQKSIFLQVRMW